MGVGGIVLLAWVLRWEVDQEFLPDLTALGSNPSVSGALSPEGDFAVFDGYLFDPGQCGPSCAQRLAEGSVRKGPAIVDELRDAFTAAVWERAHRRLIVMRDASNPARSRDAAR
jgi:hypothetical protein